MKRYIVICMALCCGAVAMAQVEKQVEVSKNYVPQVNNSATKMSITPNMVDTVTLRPEIDYSIVPRSFDSSLGTHRFRPASLTYWEYRHMRPFYLKLGVGYPLNSVGDFYATTHRADVGYLTGYVNHRGEFGKIKYQDGDGQKYKDNSSIQMTNRVGVTGGKYIGRYTLMGDAYYDGRMYSRYPLHNTETRSYDNREVNFEDIALKVRFGDSFTDLTHLNFEVFGSFDFFNDKSHNTLGISRYGSFQQIDVTAGARLAGRISPRSKFVFDVDYRGYYGLKQVAASQNSIVSAMLRYDYKSGRLLDLSLGFRFAYDHNPADATRRNRYHPFPYLRLSLNVTNNGAFVPYVEADGELQSNSYAALMHRNPYTSMLPTMLPGLSVGIMTSSALPNTAVYNVRIGMSGHTANSKLSYRLYANMSFLENSIYWYNVNQLFFNAEAARRNIWSLCAAVDYKPLSQLLISAHLRGSLYTNFANVHDGMPPVEALVRVRYTHKKFTIGATAEIIGTTTWTCFDDPSFFDAATTQPVQRYTAKAPAAVDLGLMAEWHASSACTVFIEGHNLANMDIYRWVYYREQGASFLAGVKVQF